MINEILNKIKEYDTIIIHRHIRPDGDCIGSQRALKEAIKLNFPNKMVYAVGDEIPPYLQDYGIIDEVEEELYQNALVIVVDTASRDRICNNNFEKGAFLIKIDHHDDSEDYANINYVDPLSPACASILVRLFKRWNFKFNKDIATFLYLSITTDTGRFRYRGVNEEVLTNAGFLLNYGIDTDTLYTNLYIKDAQTLKLQGYVYQHFKKTKNGVAYIYFTKELMNKFNVTKEDAANLVNCLDSIKGSLIWVVFVDQVKITSDISKIKKDTLEEIRVRIRSRFVPINEIATHYRGGGHLMAVGAIVYSLKETKMILKELDTLLKKYKEDNPNVF